MALTLTPNTPGNLLLTAPYPLSAVSVYNAIDYGADRGGTSDSTAAIQAAIDACNAAGGGTVLLPVGTYYLNSSTAKMLLLPKNSAGLRVVGVGPATVLKLSTNTPSAFGFNRTADYDTFQNIEISDLTVDRNNIATTNTHVVLGTLNGSGGTSQRLNLSKIALRRVSAISVPTPGNDLYNVALLSMHLGSGETTQTTVMDIAVEDCTFAGGDAGVIIGGTNNAATAGVNVLYDRCAIRRCRIDHGTTPVATRPNQSFQIGVLGFGGTGEISNCWAANVGDSGYSIDSATVGVMRDNECLDAWNTAFQMTNFRAPLNAAAQVYEFERCHSRVLNLTGAGAAGTGTCSAFYLNKWGGGPQTAGHIILRGCTVDSKQTQLVNGIVLADGPITALTIEDLTITLANLADTQSGSRFPNLIYVAPAVNQTLRMRNIRFKLAGSVANTGLNCRYFLIDPTAETDFQIQNVSIDHNLTGTIAAGATYGAIFGSSGGTMRGTIRRFSYLQFAGADTAPNGLFFAASSGLTIDQQIRVEDCDFAKFAAGGAAIVTNDQTNKAKVSYYGNKFQTYPRASASMSVVNFNTGTFTTAVGNQYCGGDAAEIHFANGSGAGITKIEASKDGTTYEEAWSQASGAMTQDVLVPVDNGDYVKVTFATTQPTTRVRYRK